MTAESILCCVRVSNVPKPEVPARIAKCDICGLSVWVAKSSPKGPVPRCIPCFNDTIEPDARAVPLTDRQKREIVKVFKREMQ